jgi:hypothetical protein
MERNGNIGRPHSAHGESILSVYQIFCSSSRNLHISVHRKLKPRQLHPYHIKLVQELVPKDTLEDVHFQWTLAVSDRKPYVYWKGSVPERIKLR